MILLRKLKISKITNVNFTIIEKSIIEYITSQLSDLYLEANENNPYSTYYKNNEGKTILQFDNSTNFLYVSYPNLWKILENSYLLKKEEIEILLSYMIWDLLKLKTKNIFLYIFKNKENLKLYHYGKV